MAFDVGEGPLQQLTEGVITTWPMEAATVAAVKRQIPTPGELAMERCSISLSQGTMVVQSEIYCAVSLYALDGTP